MSNVYDLFTGKRITLNVPAMLKPDSLQGPIESKIRLYKNIGSVISSGFDLSVYDRIAARFGENQPRGGVVAGLPKPKNVLDSYGRGCISNCVACTPKEMGTTTGYWNRPMPMPVDITAIERRLRNSAGKTLRLGLKSDPFMWMDRKYGVTKAVLELARFHGVRLNIFTKSDLVALDEYLPLLKGHTVTFQLLTHGGEHIAQLLEPGAPSNLRRLDAIERLKAAGVEVRVRLIDMGMSENHTPSGHEMTLNKLRVPFRTLKVKLSKWQQQQFEREVGTQISPAHAANR
jgi:hypothetical protein